MTYSKITTPIKDYLEKTEKYLIEVIKSPVNLLPEVSNYIMKSGGKRLRPALSCFWGKFLGIPEDKIIKISAIVELIHTATLMHDDVVDFADMRRGKPSANVIWGNKLSVLAGDHLISSATVLAFEINNKTLMDTLLNTVLKMIEGEAIQLSSDDIEQFSKEKYMGIIERKTASLISTSCMLPAIMAGCSEDLIAKTRIFGFNFGIAFQLVDDALDYDSDEKVTGKTVGKDLREPKITLPLIFSYQRADKKIKREIKKFLERIKKNNVREEDALKMVEIINELGGPGETRKLAVHYSEKAKDILFSLGHSNSNYLKGLERLCDYVTKRKK